MAYWKALWYLNHHDNGWSESVYFSNDSATAKGAHDYFFDLSIINGIKASCDTSTALVRTAVANVENPRLAYSDRRHTPGELDNPDNLQKTSVTNTVVNYQLTTATGRKRLFAFRALPLGWVGDSDLTGGPFVAPLLKDGLDQMCMALEDKHALIRYRKGIDVNPKYQITAVRRSATAPYVYGFETGPVTGLDIGEKFSVGGCETDALDDLNKMWKVYAMTDEIVYIQKLWQLADIAYFPGINAYLRQVEYGFEEFAWHEIHSTGTRKTGRPFSLSRGRS